MLPKSKEIQKIITERGNKSPPETVYKAGDEFCINGEFTLVTWDISSHALKCSLKTLEEPVEFYLPDSLEIFEITGKYVHPCDLPTTHDEYLVWKNQTEGVVYHPKDKTTYRLMTDPKFSATGKYWLVNVPEKGHPKARKAKEVESSDMENILRKLMYKTFDGTKVKGRLLYFTMYGLQVTQQSKTHEHRFYVTDTMRKKVVDNESSRFEIRFYVDIEGIQFFINYKVLRIE